jgi:hypothetical protein
MVNKKLIFVLILICMIQFSLAADYKLKRVSELDVGDVIVASDGSEILVEKIDSGFVSEDFVYRKSSSSLMDMFMEKVYGRDLPEQVVSGGSSEIGLSLGETGVGIRATGETVREVSQREVEGKKSFWTKLMFWRGK